MADFISMSLLCFTPLHYPIPIEPVADSVNSILPTRASQIYHAPEGGGTSYRVEWFCFPPLYPLMNSASRLYSPIFRWPRSLFTKSADYMVSLFLPSQNLQSSAIIMGIQTRSMYLIHMTTSPLLSRSSILCCISLVPSSLLILSHCVLFSVLFHLFLNSLDNILHISV